MTDELENRSQKRSNPNLDSASVTTPYLKRSKPAIMSHLDKYYETFTSNVVSGREKLIAWLAASEENIHRLLIAQPIKDINAFGCGLAPIPTDPSLVIERDKKHVQIILKISDDKKKLIGDKLKIFLACFAGTLKGNEKIIMASTLGKPDQFEALVVPFANYVPYELKWQRRSDAKVIESKGMRIIKQGTSVISYLTPEIVKYVLDLSSVPIRQVPMVLKALNDLVSKDPDYDYEGIKTLENIDSARLSATLKGVHRSFLNTLEAAMLSTATYEAKITAFAKNPSFDYACKMRFLKPYDGGLFDKNGKPVAKKKLSELNASVGVVLQNIPMDHYFYTKVLKPDMLVYPNRSDYQFRAKGNAKARLVNFKIYETIGAGQMRQIVTAVEAQATPRGGMITETVAMAVDEAEDDLEEL